MKRVEFDLDGERYRIELDADVFTMSHHHARHGWQEIARLTVAAATALAALEPVTTSDD